MHVSKQQTCMDASQTPDTKRHILIFEQDDFLNSLLHLLLHREGFVVTAISSHAQANSCMARYTPPDLLFINHTWLLNDEPALSDFNTASAGWQDVPVIAMLNYYDQQRLNELEKLGVRDVLLQPFEPGDLLDVIQKHTLHQ